MKRYSIPTQITEQPRKSGKLRELIELLAAHGVSYSASDFAAVRFPRDNVTGGDPSALAPQHDLNWRELNGRDTMCDMVENGPRDPFKFPAPMEKRPDSPPINCATSFGDRSADARLIRGNCSERLGIGFGRSGRPPLVVIDDDEPAAPGRSPLDEEVADIMAAVERISRTHAEHAAGRGTEHAPARRMRSLSPLTRAASKVAPVFRGAAGLISSSVRPVAPRLTFSGRSNLAHFTVAAARWMVRRAGRCRSLFFRNRGHG